jgi:hypothetical protein
MPGPTAVDPASRRTRLGDHRHLALGALVVAGLAALALSTADLGEEGTSLGCDGGRTAWFPTLAAATDQVDGAAIDSAVASRWPAGAVLRYGDQAMDVVTPEGSVSIRGPGGDDHDRHPDAVLGSRVRGRVDGVGPRLT